MPIRILIADDHAMFRSGVRVSLQAEDDFEVVGEAGNVDDVFTELARVRADVLLLDISMPGTESASRAVEKLNHKYRKLAVVVLTMHEDPCYLRDMLKVGARAYVLKKSSLRDLATAIRAVARGEHFVDSALGGQVVSALVSDQPLGPSGRVGLLTPREQEVCRLLAAGYTNSEVGGQLRISERTVETHRSNIMAKLELKNRADLVRFAIDNGLMDLR